MIERGPERWSHSISSTFLFVRGDRSSHVKRHGGAAASSLGRQERQDVLVGHRIAPVHRFVRGRFNIPWREGLVQQIQDAGVLEGELLGPIPARPEADDHGAGLAVLNLLGEAGGVVPIAQVQENAWRDSGPRAPGSFPWREEPG